MYMDFSGLKVPTNNIEEVLSAVCCKYGKSHNNTAADFLLDKFRKGILGRITLEEQTDLTNSQQKTITN